VAPPHGNGSLAAGEFFLLLTSSQRAARRLLDKRILFFGGKGGVGKTTCAAAFALAASRDQRRVLLVSTDPAHSTSDIFERPFAREEREILPNLFGLEIDAAFEAGRYVADVKEQIANLFSPAVASAANRQIDLAAAMPGVGDVALFDRLTQIVAAKDSAYDLVVFDTAPTGHTVRLLQMPELLGTWIHALTAHRRQALSRDRDTRGPGEPGEDEDPDPILVSLERRRQRLDEVRTRLIQHRDTSFVLVLVPERLPIEETVRAAATLTASGMEIGGLIVNRVLPDGLSGEFYQARRRQEAVYRREIDERFGAMDRLVIAQLDSDVYGVSRLERISAQIFG
jgi:arsenite/tail-anchored protein-transporting ATPase